MCRSWRNAGSSAQSAPALSRRTGASKTEVCSTRSCRSSFPSTSFISGRWMLWTEQRNGSEWQDAWNRPACENSRYVLCVLLSWTSKTAKPINAAREAATGSRSPAGPRRLETATRISASLSRRLSAFFGSAPGQGPKAAKFAVLSPGRAGFPNRAKRSEGSDTTPPSKTPRVSPREPLCAILLVKASVYPLSPVKTNVAAFVPEVLKAVRPMCWKRWYDCVSCAFAAFPRTKKKAVGYGFVKG